MKKIYLVSLLGCLAIAGCTSSNDADDTAGDGDGDGDMGGNTGDGDMGGNTGDGDMGGNTGDGDGDSVGDGVHVSGTFNGEAFEIQCAPPTDLAVGAQFIQQSPGDQVDLWQFRCRTEDQELAIWFDVADPVAGETYEQPAAADQAKIGFGSPNDIQPLGHLSANMTEMSVTVTEVDIDTGRFVASFNAAWSDEGDNYGELEGSVNVSGGWE